MSAAFRGLAPFYKLPVCWISQSSAAQRTAGPGECCHLSRRRSSTYAPKETQGMASPSGYRRPCPGTQPDHLHPPYVSSVNRAPSKPLVYLPHTLSEMTGPVFDASAVDVNACDLTRQLAGEPLGERIVVSGRVLDENGRPVSHTLVEIWQ